MAQMEFLRRDEPIPIKAVTVRPLQHSTSIKKTQALEKARLSRDLITNGGGGFQWKEEMEETSEQDSDRERYNPRRTFNDELAHLKGKHMRNAQSTGDMFWDELEPPSRTLAPPRREETPIPVYTRNDRPDWLEREEGVVVQKKKQRSSPILKKMESSWLLISSKKDRGSKHDDEAVAGLDSPEDRGVMTSTTGRFLARLRGR